MSWISGNCFWSISAEFRYCLIDSPRRGRKILSAPVTSEKCFTGIVFYFMKMISHNKVYIQETIKFPTCILIIQTLYDNNILFYLDIRGAYHIIKVTDQNIIQPNTYIVLDIYKASVSFLYCHTACTVSFL